MTDARFTPPTAPVADVPAEPPPQPVVIACGLLVLSLVLGFVSLGLEVRGAPMETPFILVGAVVMLPLLALYLWLVVMLWRRRGWARWAVLAFVAAGWLMLLLDQTGVEGPLQATMIVDGVCAVAELVAMGLVFLGPGARWFRDRPQASRAHSAAS